MNVLPIFLYLFECVPIFIPKSFFKSLNQHISSFIWNKRPARIRREILQKPRVEGGLALPNFLFYYWAANIHSTLFWFQNHFCLCDWVPAWVSIEEGSCSPASPAALMCGPLTAVSRLPYGNSIVRQSLPFQFHSINSILAFNDCHWSHRLIVILYSLPLLMIKHVIVGRE